MTTHTATRSGQADDAAYVELVQRAMDGDERALQDLLERSQDVARRFSRAVCGGQSDADDAAQEALLNTYRYVRGLRDPEAFRSWLYRTVRNACLIGRRRRAGEPAWHHSLDMVAGALGGDEAAAQPRSTDRSPEERAVNASLRQQLRDALLSVPKSYRVVLFLRDMEGLSTREVAEVVGISEDNVKARLHRARAQVRRRLAGSR